jgi:hypothetical protein
MTEPAKTCGECEWFKDWEPPHKGYGTCTAIQLAIPQWAENILTRHLRFDTDATDCACWVRRGDE